MVLEAKIPDMSIKAKRPPISPPFNLSKFDLIKSIDKKTIVALREEIFKKANGQKGFNNIFCQKIILPDSKNKFKKPQKKKTHLSLLKIYIKFDDLCIRVKIL